MIRHSKRSVLQKFSDAIGELYEATHPDDLGPAILQSMRAVVPAEVWAYTLLDRKTGKTMACTDPVDVPAADLQVFAAHLNEHPSISSINAGVGEVVRWSDFCTVRQFRQRALYHDFFRVAGVNYQVGCGLHVDEGWTILPSANRRHRDFSVHERALMQLLVSHWQRAWSLASARSEMAKTLDLHEVGLHGIAVLVIDIQGRICLHTPEALRFCQDQFGWGSPVSAPPVLLAWLAKQTAADARWTIDREDRRLTITAHGPVALPGKHSRTNGGRQCCGYVIRFLDQPAAVPAAALESLGLTRREAEVLGWMAQGKRNGEIAVILRAQRRTIEKHVENILSKLGVETRTAAVAMVWEKL